MDQYEEFKGMLAAYFEKNKLATEYMSDFHETSYSDAGSIHLYEKDQKDTEVINMDAVAQNAYRKIRFPDSNRREDSISTNDAFLICGDNKWYFVEFKDQKLNAVKDSISKKAYCNWHMLLDILYEMKQKNRLSAFWYDDPIRFARENVILILVVSEEKNPMDAKRIQDSITAGQRYVPVFLEKLKKYIYHNVYLYTPATFEKYFVKKLQSVR